jgi:alkanesulfonate monooxygenase SsuD/methylene tetrahydromethanopterin reductase-like flavin-dependent oxidoreductase (luciferase family)
VTDYGRELSFGFSLAPAARDLSELRELTRLADRVGLDWVGLQDHPYQRRFLDTWVLLAWLLAETEHIRAFPNVANLPLRGPPAMIAKAAASLDLLSGGRFELGLGAGSFWEAIAAMGGPRRRPRESVDALAEAIEVIRLCWSDRRSVSYRGTYYSLDDLHPGPTPPHRIEIWLGAYKPRMLGLTGGLADGWLPSHGYLAPENVPEARGRIDAAARDAGRDPAAIRRLYNVSGSIGPSAGEGGLRGPVEHWVATLTAWATKLGFDTFVFWPEADWREQIERFAGEVAPAVRASVARGREGRPS